MRNRLRDAILVVVTAAGVWGLMAATRQRTDQMSAGISGVRRAPDGKPDLSGVWQANNTANWDLQAHEPRPMVSQPGVYADVPVLAAPVVALGAIGWLPGDRGVVEGSEIPYQPWAAQRKRENFANWLDRDPEIQCFLPGVPRAMYMPYRFQIIHGTTKIMMVFEFRGAQRVIHLDEVEPYPAEAFMGHSVARWEGDVLVVDVSSFTAHTWFDRAGNFHSDALHVVERYSPISPDALLYEATIEDSKVFTRPWKISMPIYRRLEPDAQIMEFRCPEFVEETTLGHLRKQQLVKQWQGKTMRIDVTRIVPQAEAVYERHVDGNPPMQ
jgi:hypothetical protein